VPHEHRPRKPATAGRRQGGRRLGAGRRRKGDRGALEPRTL